jgi:invasion protein IalB
MSGTSRGNPPPGFGGRVGASLTAVAVAAALIVGITGAARAQGAVRSVHGDWQIRCDTPPGAQGEQCALIQSVVAEDRSNAGLTVIVLIMSTSAGPGSCAACPTAALPKS